MPQLSPVQQILSPAESEAHSFPEKERWPLTQNGEKGCGLTGPQIGSERVVGGGEVVEIGSS